MELYQWFRRCVGRLQHRLIEDCFYQLIYSPFSHRPYAPSLPPLPSPAPRPPNIVHNHCSQFLLRITVIPRQNEDNGYAKFGGVNKVYDGLCENGEL